MDTRRMSTSDRIDTARQLGERFAAKVRGVLGQAEAERAALIDSTLYWMCRPYESVLDGRRSPVDLDELLIQAWIELAGREPDLDDMDDAWIFDWGFLAAKLSGWDPFNVINGVCQAFTLYYDLGSSPLNTVAGMYVRDHRPPPDDRISLRVMRRRLSGTPAPAPAPAPDPAPAPGPRPRSGPGRPRSGPRST